MIVHLLSSGYAKARWDRSADGSSPYLRMRKQRQTHKIPCSCAAPRWGRPADRSSPYLPMRKQGQAHKIPCRCVAPHWGRPADGSCPYLRMRKRHMVTKPFKVKTARNDIQSNKTLPRKIWRSVTQGSGFDSLLDQYSENGSGNWHLINIKNVVAVPVPTQWLQ